jgi:dUTP pyrophosphatase
MDPLITPKVPKSLASEFIDISNKRRKIRTPIVADSPEFIPVYASKGAACCDLKACLENDSIFIGPMQTVKIYVGFRMALPPGWEAQIRPRSGFGAKAIIMPNSPGTIDEDYRGKMCVLLTNLKQETVEIKHLDRIAQMKLEPVWYFEFDPVDTLDNTERGEGGFGSTGV